MTRAAGAKVHPGLGPPRSVYVRRVSAATGASSAPAIRGGRVAGWTGRRVRTYDHPLNGQLAWGRSGYCDSDRRPGGSRKVGIRRVSPSMGRPREAAGSDAKQHRQVKLWPVGTHRAGGADGRFATSARISCSATAAAQWSVSPPAARRISLRSPADRQDGALIGHRRNPPRVRTERVVPAVLLTASRLIGYNRGPGFHVSHRGPAPR